jgi:tRNA U34 5-carboxymethylaminomethyl modifying GTPase MnmE/TrmE
MIVKSIFNSIKLQNSKIPQLLFKRYRSTTIYALASGSNQRCGVAVVRLSGTNCVDILSKLTKNKKENVYEPRKMYLRDIWHPVTSEKIDKGLVVWFKGLHFLFNHV